MREVDDAGWIAMRKADRNAASKGAAGRDKLMLGHVTTLVRNSRSDCGARLDSEQLLQRVPIMVVHSPTYLSRSADVGTTIRHDHIIDLVVGNWHPFAIDFDFVAVANSLSLGSIRNLR